MIISTSSQNTTNQILRRKCLSYQFFRILNLKKKINKKSSSMVSTINPLKKISLTIRIEKKPNFRKK